MSTPILILLLILILFLFLIVLVLLLVLRCKLATTSLPLRVLPRGEWPV